MLPGPNLFLEEDKADVFLTADELSMADFSADESLSSSSLERLDFEDKLSRRYRLITGGGCGCGEGVLLLDWLEDLDRDDD